jgi:hypothetical protein
MTKPPENEPNRVPLKGVEAVPPISRAEPITAEVLEGLGFARNDRCYTGSAGRFTRVDQHGHTIDILLWPDGRASVTAFRPRRNAYANSPADLARIIEFIQQTTSTEST